MSALQNPLADALSHSAPSSASGPDKALVIADDIGVFLAVVRSLARAGIAVDVASCGEEYPGLTSRYIRQHHVLPAYLHRQEEWLDALCALAEKEQYRLIFPTSDSSLGLLAHIADAIGPDRVAVPDLEILRNFTDKNATRSLAIEHKVPVAKGINLIAGQGGFAQLVGVEYPSVIKPVQSYCVGNRDAKMMVRIVRDPAELSQAMDDLEGQPIIAEQFFEGEGVGISVIAEGGQVRLAWQHRRQSSVSAAGRSSRRVGEVPDPAMLDDVKTLVAASGLNGVAMFEFRHNPASGEHILIEVNPRFWGSLPLALSAGADFPLTLWDLLTGQDRSSAQAPRLGFSKSDLSGEFDRLAAQIGGLPALISAAAAVVALMFRAGFSPSAFDGWAKDDPAPHWAELRQVAGWLKDAVVRVFR